MNLGRWMMVVGVFLVAACSNPKQETPPIDKALKSSPPIWWGSYKDTGEWRYFEGTASGHATREGAIQSAHVNALEQASESIYTNIKSSFAQRGHQINEQLEEEVRSTVETSTMAQFKGSSRENDAAVQITGGFDGYVCVKVPASHFVIDDQWFLDRSRERKRDAPEEALSFLVIGTQDYPDSLKLHGPLRQTYRDNEDWQEAFDLSWSLFGKVQTEEVRRWVEQSTLEYADNLEKNGDRRKAREILRALLRSDFDYPRADAIRDRIARSFHQQGVESQRVARLDEAIRLFDQGLEVAVNEDLRSQLEEARTDAKASRSDQFGTMVERLLLASTRGEDESTLRLGLEGSEVKLPDVKLPFSLWTSEALDLWVVWIEEEAVYSVDHLRNFSGRQVFGEREDVNEGTDLTISADTKPGEIHYVVLGSRSGTLDFWEHNESFEREHVNNPSRDPAGAGSEDSHAARLDHFVRALEKAIGSKELVAAQFSFRVR